MGEEQRGSRTSVTASRPDPGSPLIERSTPRALFAQLVGQALGETRVRPTPMATAYLIELLDERVRSPAAQDDEPATLAEAWFSACDARGPTRLRRLRRLGDRALFISGYFTESLVRSVVSGGYYREMGRSAYAALANSLEREARGHGWPRLFEERADRFPDLVMVLGEVSDRARGSRSGRPEWLLGLYERYLATGSERDRRRLVRAGCVPPPERGERWQ